MKSRTRISSCRHVARRSPGAAGWIVAAAVAFALAAPAGAISILHSFTEGADGTWPYGSLVLDGAGNLYGTTSQGGTSGKGTVFTLKTNGKASLSCTAFSAAPLALKMQRVGLND